MRRPSKGFAESGVVVGGGGGGKVGEGGAVGSAPAGAISTVVVTEATTPAGVGAKGPASSRQPDNKVICRKSRQMVVARRV